MKQLLKKVQQNKGLSLVEVLVTLAVSSIVFSVIIVFVSSGTRFFNKQGTSIDLQNELQEVSNVISDTLMEATALYVTEEEGALLIHTGEYQRVNGVYEFVNNKNTARLIYWDGESLYIFEDPTGTGYPEDELEGFCYSHCVSDIKVSIDSSCQIKVAGNKTAYSQPLMVKVEITVSANNASRSDSKISSVRNKITNMEIDGVKYVYSNGNLVQE